MHFNYMLTVAYCYKTRIYSYIAYIIVIHNNGLCMHGTCILREGGNSPHTEISVLLHLNRAQSVCCLSNYQRTTVLPYN